MTVRTTYYAALTHAVCQTIVPGGNPEKPKNLHGHYFASTGKITLSEFKDCLNILGLDFRLDEQLQLFKWYDANRNGTVSYDELIRQADLVDHLIAPWPSSLR
jgi:hypothetical protein